MNDAITNLICIIFHVCGEILRSRIIGSKARVMSVDVARLSPAKLYHFHCHEQCMTVCFPSQCARKHVDPGQTKRRAWYFKRTWIIPLSLGVKGHLTRGFDNSLLVHLSFVFLIWDLYNFVTYAHYQCFLSLSFDLVMSFAKRKFCFNSYPSFMTSGLCVTLRNFFPFWEFQNSPMCLVHFWFHFETFPSLFHMEFILV